MALIIRLKKVFEHPYYIKNLLRNDNIVDRYTKTESVNYENIILKL